MKSFTIELSDEEVRVMTEAAAEREMTLEAFILDLVKGRAWREQKSREPLTEEQIRLAAEFAEEDRQLAEADMEDYARALEEEDRA